ncbi:nuclear transport factor 2 family protein [Microtetraspora niveoalba]|uniref:nuclear transport factor 2 family protein n=1 Tax=Microtetraspora niveoalba TaxID=46175 RepID=UPI0008312D99|nr:nuclear transport factor 2 family protein [Microtetraspora niveoalba]
MTPNELAETYLDGLARGDLPAVLALFRPGAIVHSPLYGPIPATEFYPALFADTGRAKLNLLGVADGTKTSGGRLVTVWFQFDWTLPSGQPADFECVDVLELADDGRVEALHIVYDTVTARPAYEAEKGEGSSWRPSA